MYFKIEYILFVKKILFVKTSIGKKNFAGSESCIVFYFLEIFLVSVCLSLSKLLIPPMPSIPAMMGQSSCQSSFGGITLSSSSIDKRLPNNSVPQTAITNSVPQTKKG